MLGYVKRSPNELVPSLDAYVGGNHPAGAESINDDLVKMVAQDAFAGATASVAVVGRPLWEDDSAASAETICQAFQQQGESVVARLNGGFALAIADRASSTLYLAIDRMGASSLSWTNANGRLVFSTSSYAIARRPEATARLRNQAIYDYFFFHMVPAPATVFEGVHKLRAGQILRWTPDGIDIRPYWRPSLAGRDRADFDQLRDELHQALRAAVSALRPGRTTGAFLSGGLDSSTVAGVLSRLRTAPDTFSIGFGVPGFDERPYARITSRHFECTHHEYEVTPDDVVDALPIIAASYDEPFGNSSAIPTYICARFARESGMTELLAGDGGDELFGGNERYARHKVFELYNRIPSALRTPMTSLVRGTISPEIGITPLRKVRSYVDQASIPLPERLESWNFVYREGARAMFDGEFMADVDPEGPLRDMRVAYDACASTCDAPEEVEYLDRMLMYDWKFTLADNDLRKVTTTCRAAGIDVLFPMLDTRVVDVSLRVPNRMKMPGLALRHFYRKAMRGFLADETLAKRKKGFGLPFGHWLKENARLSDFVYGSLADLKRRTIVRGDFIDQLIRDHRSGHPGYYGYVIWDLVILEEWFKSHAA